MVAMLVLLLQDPLPYKLSFEADKPSKTVEASLKKIAGVSNVAVQGSKITLTLKWEAQLKLSALKEILDLKIDTLKVGSRVYFDFKLDNSEGEKILAAIKSFKEVESVKPEGSIIAVIFKDNSSVLLSAVVEAVAKKVGKKEDKPMELVTEITWHPIKPFPKPAPG